MNRNETQKKALLAENMYMRKNIEYLRQVISDQNAEINLIKNSKGYKIIEKIRKLMFWRR